MCRKTVKGLYHTIFKFTSIGVVCCFLKKLFVKRYRHLFTIHWIEKSCVPCALCKFAVALSERKLVFFVKHSNYLTIILMLNCLNKEE